MRGFASAPSDPPTTWPRQPSRGVPKVLLAGAAVYAAAHLPFLARSLEDIDSINFALGLRDFDVAQHQPHPPGYPVYIGIGRVALGLVRLVPAARPALDRGGAGAGAAVCACRRGGRGVLSA